MHKIEPIGVFFPLGADGAVKNPTSKNKVPGEWLPLLKDLETYCVKELGDRLHSIWLRGSLARGSWRAGMSDADFLLLIHSDKYIRWAVPDFKVTLEIDLQRKHPFLGKLELMWSSIVDPLEKTYPQMAMIIKTQALCLYGQNPQAQLPEYRPGPDMILNQRWLASDWQDLLAKPILQIEECQQFMKVFIRSAFEWVMEKEGQYAVDLYPCASSFAQHYPQWSKDIFKALEIYLNPLNESDQIKESVGQLVDWLIEQIESNLVPGQLPKSTYS